MIDRPTFPYEQHPDLVYAAVQPSGPGNPRNDTASVARLGSGEIMVVWHKYRATERGTSDFGRSDIAARMSHDEGRSWGSERLLVKADPVDNNVQAPALRRLKNGDLLLICLRGHAGGESSSMLLYRSTDDGATFYSQSTVWSHSTGQWLQGGASSLLELQSGRLLLPYHGGMGHQGKQHNVARCAYSDDSGRTWQHGQAAVDLPMRGAMEASVAELRDGELVMSLRTQLGAVFFSRSIDRGETWPLPQTIGLRAPESCTCLRCVPGTDDLLLLWNDSLYDPAHHHYGVRTPLSLALSRDRGQTWHKIANLAHAEGYNFTNLGCDFVDDRLAVVTYCVYGPDRTSDDQVAGWQNPEVFHLHAVLLDVDWVYEQVS